MNKDNHNQPNKTRWTTSKPALALATLLLIAALAFSAVVLIGPSTSSADPLPTTPPPAPTSRPPSASPTIDSSTPAPTEVPASAAGVRRIAIARFAGTTGASEIDQSVEGSLLAAVASAALSNSIEVVRTHELATSYSEAQTQLEQYKADMLIWGQVDQASVRAQTTVAARTLPDLQRVHFSPQPLTIFFPPEMEIYLSRELGTDMTFLSLVALGQIHLADGALADAQEQFQSALLTMPPALPREARTRGVAIVNFYESLIPENSNNALAQLQIYSQALRFYDTFTSANNNRGTIYFDTGDYQAALADFDAALSQAPPTASDQVPIELFNRSVAHYALQDTSRALADAKRAIAQAPDNARSYNLQGLLNYNAGDFESALQDFTRATELAPQSAGAQFNLAATLAALGQSDQAVDAYNLLLERDPQDALALAYRGDAYLQQGLTAEAVTSYDEALKHDLTLVYAYQRRAAYYFERSNLDIALADLQAALANSQQDALTFALLGDVYSAQHELADAEQAYDDALALQPDLVQALAGRGSVRRAQRIFISALKDLESALEMGGPTPPLQLDLGLVYYELGRFADAQQSFEDVIANSEQPAAGHAGLALALDSQLEREAAQDSLSTTLQLDQRFADRDYLRDELYWSPNALRRLETINRRLELAETE